MSCWQTYRGIATSYFLHIFTKTVFDFDQVKLWWYCSIDKARFATLTRTRLTALCVYVYMCPCVSVVDSCYADLRLLERLLAACITCLKPQYLDLPVGLVARLVLSDATFIDQFVRVVNDHNVSPTAIISRLISRHTCLQCFDTVGSASGRASVL